MLRCVVIRYEQVLAHHTVLVNKEMVDLKSEVQRVCDLNVAGAGDVGEGERNPDGESLPVSVSGIFLPILEALTVRLMATRQVPLLLSPPR